MLQKAEPDYLQVLDIFGHELDEPCLTAKSGKPIKILYGHAFSIYPPCFVHDRIFSYALRIRGAEIIPLYCDGVQSIECNVYGGVWGGELQN